MGWGALLAVTAGAVALFVGVMVAPITVPQPELQRVPPGDQGIDYERPAAPDAYPLIELWSGRGIVEHGRPVYVDAEGRRIALPERAAVPPTDQGIDFAHPLRPGVYPLRQVSSGQQLTERGEPIYVDADGRRIPPGQLAP